MFPGPGQESAVVPLHTVNDYTEWLSPVCPAELEVEQSGPKSVPIWDTGIIGSSLTQYSTMPATSQ